MCTYYYLHYHHPAPLIRDIEYTVYYSFCPNSTSQVLSSSSLSSIGTSDVDHSGEQWIRQPCDALTYAPEYSLMEGIDYNNPCAAGGCHISQQCSSGGCGLEDLGDSWICCRCNRGGNTLRWCIQPMKKIPDPLCYHAIYRNCLPDNQ